MALIDINIITKNRPTYLPVLLWSLKNQVFKDFRVILINDGETLDEASLSILNDFEYIIHNNKTSLGIPKSRNKALQLSSAKFIFRVDDDHFCDSMCLDYLFKAFQRNANNVGSIGCIMPFVSQGPPVVGKPIKKSQMIDFNNHKITDSAQFDQ